MLLCPLHNAIRVGGSLYSQTNGQAGRQTCRQAGMVQMLISKLTSISALLRDHHS